MINKELVNKIMDIAEHIYLGTQVEITKDDETNTYEVRDDGYGCIELVCLTEENAIWNDAEFIDDLREDLICSAVRGHYQDIRLV